jgi:RNA polymerase sigma factor (sigma-70 family)
MESWAPEALVWAAAGGDQKAWDELVRRFNNLVWSIARSFRLSTDDASDVVQTTWLRLVENLGRLQQPERVGAWLATTAKNECLSHLRRRDRQGLAVDNFDDYVDVTASTDAAVLIESRDALLWAAVNALPERCRRLLRVLAADPPPSYLEVGAILDMPVGSIGPIRGRCLEHLRREMAAAGNTDDLQDSR